MKQHATLRVPESWKGQDRSFVVQLEQLLDDIYINLGQLENKITALDESTSTAISENATAIAAATIPYVDLYGASTLEMLKTNLVLKVYQKTTDKYCNFRVFCGWNDTTWGEGEYFGTSVVSSKQTNHRRFFIIFYPVAELTGSNTRPPVYIRYSEDNGTAGWFIQTIALD